MFEGRANASGLTVVVLAIAALLAFTVLLYVRGASGPNLPIAGAIGGPTPVPTIPGTPAPTTSGSAGPSGASSSPGGSVAPAAGGSASPSETGSAGPSASTTATPRPTATPKPTATPRPTPRPSRTPRPSPSSSAAAFQLPANPQAATASLDDGQGDCAGFPSGGVEINTSFRIRSPGQLTATSPLGQVLTGRISGNGTFTLSGQSPVEKWTGRLTASGGSGTYSVVSNDCTQAYTTTITFT